jgi:hypothetical protein
MFGPTYETRNKWYDMNEGMRELLYAYYLKGPREFLTAWSEGLRAGRIWEAPHLKSN